MDDGLERPVAAPGRIADADDGAWSGLPLPPAMIDAAIDCAADPSWPVGGIPGSALAAAYFSQRDALTGLPDRRLFRQVLQHAIAKAAARRGSLTLLLLDIDEFSHINDLLGHDAGDTLLVEVACRLVQAFDGESVAARLGSDEFALLLTNRTGPHDVDGVIARVLELLAVPVEIGCRAVSVRASVGAAFHPDDASNADTLLKHATIALHHARALPHGRITCFSPAMEQAVAARAQLLHEMRCALSQDQLEVHYQPIIDLRTRICRGLEALVRWRHPKRGLLTPAHFIAALEDPDLSVLISDSVLERSIDQMRHWLDLGVPRRCVVNVNVVIGQFRNGDLAPKIRRLLDENGLAPEQLKLEVTERVFLDRKHDGVEETLEDLRHFGVLSALDDFGTGYASLTHLRRFKVDRLKIDRSFVSNMCTDPGDAAIVRAILDLGRSFGLRVTAEGIETRAQLRQLMQLGCDCGQGFLLGRPMPAGGIPDFLEGWAAGTATRLFDDGIAAS